jgi:hypothetical protein
MQVRHAVQVHDTPLQILDWMIVRLFINRKAGWGVQLAFELLYFFAIGFYGIYTDSDLH